MKIKCLVFNYNLGDEADAIHHKLCQDGFDAEDIVVVDNGSNAELKARETNFSLPWNCRFSGQSSLALRYLHHYFPADYYLLITTSAGLQDDVNYYNNIGEIVGEFANGERLGMVVASLFGGRTNEGAPLQASLLMEDDYVDVFHVQPIVTLISHTLVSKCIDLNAAYFNSDLARGWGIDRELKYVADSYGMKTYVSKRMVVEWKTNLTHKKGVADESQEDYWSNADVEMQNAFNDRYGYFWNKIFLLRHRYKNTLFLLLPLFLLSVVGRIVSRFRSLRLLFSKNSVNNS